MPQQVELLPPLGSEVPLVEEVAFLDPSEFSEWTSFQGPQVRFPLFAADSSPIWVRVMARAALLASSS